MSVERLELCGGRATVYVGDVRAGLAAMPERSVQCCVTSPPYFALRDYGVDGQIGLEETPEAFIAALVEVFRGVRRVLRDDGVCFVNMGDSYAANRGYQVPDSKHVDVGNSMGSEVPPGLKPKDLCGIPWRLAFALQADGWYLRSDIIWCLSGGAHVYAKTQNGEGPTTIKDLVRLNPDTVQLWNGEKWTRVLGWNKSQRPKSPIELELRSGERIGCTPEHRWPTQRGVIKASEIRVGDVIQTCRLPAPKNPRQPGLLPDEEIGYLVGLYIAEGSKSGDTIQLAGHLKDSTRLRKLENIAALLDGTCAIHKTSENGATYNMHGPMIHGAIATYVSGNKAYGKHLHPRCWGRSDAFLSAVLRGYLDGDGYFDGDNNRWRLGFTENDSLAQDLRTICARIGATISLRRTFHKMRGRRFPGYRGEIRFDRTGHANEKPMGEVVAIGQSRARQFWDIGVADDPHLFALASGVLTHNSKPNPMPESVTDRPTKSHEYIFLLTKSARYFWDAEGVREPHKDAEREANRPSRRENMKKAVDDGFSTYHIAEGQASLDRPMAGHPMGRNVRTVWQIATQAYPGSHFATFPEAIPERCIKAGTSERGCCPECGEPWVRETNTTREHGGSKWAPNDGNRAAVGDVSATSVFRTGLQPITRTIGWRPGCECGRDPVPCRVLDPFLGSGTTIAVALKLGRHGVGCELNPKYVELARERIGLAAGPATYQSPKIVDAPLFVGGGDDSKHT